jgi:oxygen-independent coproporphyrinogen-3 oxidase
MVYWQLMPVYSLYLHIPFCQHRCCYCDFNTYAGQDDLIPAYVEGLCREIEQAAMAAGERLPVHTVFFGGGTPSLLPPHALERILRALSDHFDVRAGSEITLEANPGTLSQDYLRALHGLGIDRLSLGMQSAHPAELELLERGHDYGDVIRAVQWARGAGFENLSLDLIFGLPYQAMQTWQRSLELAVNLAPEHLSLYALTLEHGTPMQRWTSKGLLSEPDADLAAVR